MRTQTCGVAACLLAFGRGVLALNTATLLRRQAPEPSRQTLDNSLDLQYSGNFTVGNQVIRGIIDTGSFEFVLFSKNCGVSCGVAGKFDEHASSSFVAGPHSMVQEYGSGSCESQDATDAVGVLGLSTQRQDMWLAKTCGMPLLDTAFFNAIVGVGPPGQPAYMAEWNIKQMQTTVDQFQALNETVPESIVAEKQAAEQELQAVTGKRALLENLNVRTFSICLGKQSGSSGSMTWNDHYRAGQPGVLRLAVAGEITWGLKLGSVGLGSKTFACEAESCVGVVDSGTSMIGLSSSAYMAVYQALTSGDYSMDCSDLSHFPDLSFTLGGQQLSLPPSAYIGSTHGKMSAEVAAYMSRRHLGEPGVSTPTPCELLLMDLGEQTTTLGSMWVLGMPFFRQYYTTFDLGTGRGDRSLLVMPPSPTCEPDLQPTLQTFRTRNKEDVTPRQIDASKIMLPRWLHKRKGRKP